MTINQNLSVVNTFVDQLFSLGVRNIVISPGSRSTPLTMSFTRDARFTTWTLLDERSAGFFAMGLSRESGTPSVLVCTSGTAVANYLPAIMEARQSFVPLIVLTADRPPELHSAGSNQTIDQLKVFGAHVLDFFLMPVPVDVPEMHAQARSTAIRAVLKSSQATRGPVHVNWPFREPLVPPYVDMSLDEQAPQTSIFAPKLSLSTEGLEFLENLLRSDNGLIVCGPQDDDEAAKDIAKLSTQFGLPVCADVLSQVRGLNDDPYVIDSYDVFFRADEFRSRLKPNFILRFGRTPTSKVLGQFLALHSDIPQIVVSDTSDYHDPFFTSTQVIVAGISEVCRALMKCETPFTPTTSQWVETWQRLNEDVRDYVRRELSNYGEDGVRFEGTVVPALANVLPSGATVFVGNSMPVRDFDSFYYSSSSRFKFLANRGVSGIDGVVSTAEGVAAANRGPVVLVIGDVSFYHDLGALYAAVKHHINILVVLMNNNGGGIFSFLPQSSYPDTFHQFGTPHGMSFRQVVEMFGGDYRRAETWVSFESDVREWLQTGGVCVIEVLTNAEENVKLHRELFHNALTLLDGRA